jgi:choline monooxygenase
MVERLNFKIDNRIEYAETLPSTCYTNRDYLAVEEERIFARTWQLVGRIDQLPVPGSYLTAMIGREPVVIVRDLLDELRGFINICRHRAGPVASGSGCADRLRCGYHGWTYDLTGQLIGLPDFKGAADFEREKMGLVPIEIAQWEQFIFARLQSQAPFSPSLLDLLGEIPAVTAGYDIGSMRFAGRRDYTIECNWKVYIDNYVEGYHVPIIHPGLMREIDYRNYRTVTSRYHSRQDAPIRSGKDDGRRYLADGDHTEALYFWVFPNLMLNIYPDNVSTNLILPLDHERTLTIFEWFFHDVDSKSTQERIAASIRLSDEIQQEDIVICEAVQRRLGSRYYDRGRYSPQMENGLHHFHSLWLEWMNME